MKIEKKYLSIKKTAKLLGVTPLTLRNWDKSNKLKALRNPLNNYRVYRLEDINLFLGKIESQKKINKKQVKQNKNFRFLIYLIAIFLFLVTFIVLLNLNRNNTKIKIWPEIEIMSFERTVTIREGNYYDFSENIIPGQTLKINKVFSKQFSSTGKTAKEEKATGIIRVYNNHSTIPQALVATTRFISSDGKMFRSLKYNIVPGQRYEDGELIPGFTDIEVIAAESGEDYNIEPSEFSIPGFAGTYKYDFFYGKSFKPMEGGFKDKIDSVTESDINKGKKDIFEKLKKISKEELLNISPNNFIFIEQGIVYEIKEEECSHKPEEISESFFCSLKVDATTFIISKEHAEKFTKQLILSEISEENTFREEDITIGYSLNNFKKEDNIMKVDIAIEVKTHPDINIENLKQNISGKSFRDAEVLFKKDSRIIRAEMNKGVFWRKIIPKNINKIEMDLVLN